MESSNKEEANLCITTNQKYKEVTSHFSYHDLFRLCKKLKKETSKLEQIISTTKDIISSLELKNKNFLEEIEILRERKYDLI